MIRAGVAHFVRFRPLVDILFCTAECPLLGAKQTLGITS